MKYAARRHHLCVISGCNFHFPCEYFMIPLPHAPQWYDGGSVRASKSHLSSPEGTTQEPAASYVCLVTEPLNCHWDQKQHLWVRSPLQRILCAIVSCSRSAALHHCSSGSSAASGLAGCPAGPVSFDVTDGFALQESGCV